MAALARSRMWRSFSVGFGHPYTLTCQAEKATSKAGQHVATKGKRGGCPWLRCIYHCHLHNRYIQLWLQLWNAIHTTKALHKKNETKHFALSKSRRYFSHIHTDLSELCQLTTNLMYSTGSLPDGLLIANQCWANHLKNAISRCWNKLIDCFKLFTLPKNFTEQQSNVLH